MDQQQGGTKSLFLDRPSELEKRIDRLIDHFRHAEWMFFELEGAAGLPTPRKLIWLLFQDSAATLRTMPRDDLAQLSRMPTIMPNTRTTIDEAYAIEVSRLNSGMAQWDSKEARSPSTQTAADRMVDVLDLLRFVAAGRGGKDVLRLKRSFLARAAGLSIEQCGRIYDRHRTDFDRRAMHDIKDRVIGQILSGIEREFGLVRTSRSFRRLTLREIEAKKRRQKRQEERARQEAQADD